MEKNKCTVIKKKIKTNNPTSYNDCETQRPQHQRAWRSSCTFFKCETYRSLCLCSVCLNNHSQVFVLKHRLKSGIFQGIRPRTNIFSHPKCKTEVECTCCLLSFTDRLKLMKRFNKNSIPLYEMHFCFHLTLFSCTCSAEWFGVFQTYSCKWYWMSYLTHLTHYCIFLKLTFKWRWQHGQKEISHFCTNCKSWCVTETSQNVAQWFPLER